MKRILITLTTLICSIATTQAQAPIPEVAQPDKPYDMPITDEVAVNIIESIEGYVYAKPPTKDSIKIFDSDKGEIVKLQYQKVVTGPECTKQGKDGYIAVCANFLSEDQVSYVLWFVLRKQVERQERVKYTKIVNTKPLGAWTVRDVLIKSVGGVEKYEWTQDGEGKWVPKEVELGADGTPLEDALVEPTAEERAQEAVAAE